MYTRACFRNQNTLKTVFVIGEWGLFVKKPKREPNHHFCLHPRVDFKSNKKKRNWFEKHFPEIILMGSSAKENSY